MSVNRGKTETNYDDVQDFENVVKSFCVKYTILNKIDECGLDRLECFRIEWKALKIKECLRES